MSLRSESVVQRATPYRKIGREYYAGSKSVGEDEFNYSIVANLEKKYVVINHL